jgi:hypothetical protein
MAVAVPGFRFILSSETQRQMLPNFFVLPLAAIPSLVPLSAQLVQKGVPTSYQEVGKVPLPQLSSEQWKMLSQMQGADHKPLRLDVTLSVDQGQVYGVGVLRGTGYSDVDSAVVRWIQANWKTAPWFGVGTQSAVSFDIDPTLHQVRFATRAG